MYTPNFPKIDFSIKNPWYTIIQHCDDIDFPQKIGILRFFLRKFLLTVFHIFHGKYTPNFFYCPKFQKWNLWSKILNIQKYNIVPHWFSSKKLDFCVFFFKKVSIDGFTHFWSKIHPKFSKNRFFHIPQYIIYCNQNFMLFPTIKLLEFSDKNWETYERLLIFWSIFWLFFLLSKVSKMKFYQKSLIYKNTTLYDIDFPQKIGFLRFFLRKFLLTVFHIIDGKYY